MWINKFGIRAINQNPRRTLPKESCISLSSSCWMQGTINKELYKLLKKISFLFFFLGRLPGMNFFSISSRTRPGNFFPQQNIYQIYLLHRANFALTLYSRDGVYFLVQIDCNFFLKSLFI